MMRGAVLAAALLCAAGAAHAQEADPLSGALLAMRDRGTIRIGVREASVPFAFRNRSGQAIGFSVDLCRAIATDAASAVNRDLIEPDAPAWQTGLRIAFVTVAADDRLRMMMSGDIDLECGSTTATDERAKSVAFSPVFFVAGTKLATRPGQGIASWRDLAGKSVAVSTGTTNETVLKRLASQSTPPLTVVSLPSVDAAFEAVTTGKAAAVASDDILLAGTIASSPAYAGLRVAGDYLSFEPYAIMLPKDDPAFLALVRASFARLAESGMLRASYQRWFMDPLPTGGSLGLPMSAQLSEIFRALGQPD